MYMWIFRGTHIKTAEIRNEQYVYKFVWKDGNEIKTMRERDIYIFFVLFCITWAHDHTTGKEKNIEADYISMSNVHHGCPGFIEYMTIFILTINPSCTDNYYVTK
jgi:hypothetical protein